MNPYHGINAHFNSLLQNIKGGWLTFHNNHIADLTRALNENLPPKYYAVSELSLQIQLPFDERTGYADVGIASQARLDRVSQPRPASSATLQVETRDLELSEENLAAVEIYYQNGDSHLVARIELLSPSNKRAPYAYLAMRQKMIGLGINMVDIDYLHEQASLFRGILPVYPSDEDAYPYCISLSDSQLTDFHCFHVDDSIPVLLLPLLGDDKVSLDLGTVYNLTIQSDRRTVMLVDYHQEPINFSSYSLSDQERILAVMGRFRQSQTDGE